MVHGIDYLRRCAWSNRSGLRDGIIYQILNPTSVALSVSRVKSKMKRERAIKYSHAQYCTKDNRVGTHACVRVKIAPPMAAHLFSNTFGRDVQVMSAIGEVKRSAPCNPVSCGYVSSGVLCKMYCASNKLTLQKILDAVRLFKWIFEEDNTRYIHNTSNPNLLRFLRLTNQEVRGETRLCFSSSTRRTSSAPVTVWQHAHSS